MDFSVQGLEQGHGVLGYGVRRVGRHSRDDEAELARRVQIHVVKARAAQRDMPRSRGGQRGEARAIKRVVHEYAHRPRALRAGDRALAEAKLVEAPVDVHRPLRPREGLPVVGFGVEKGDRVHEPSLVRQAAVAPPKTPPDTPTPPDAPAAPAPCGDPGRAALPSPPRCRRRARTHAARSGTAPLPP